MARPNACSRMFVSLWGLLLIAPSSHPIPILPIAGLNTGSAILILSSCPILDHMSPKKEAGLVY